MSRNPFMQNMPEIQAAGGLVPMVIEQSARGERAYDIYSRLLKERVISWSVGSRTTWPT